MTGASKQTSPTPPLTGLNTALWIVQALLNLTFVGTGIWKVTTPIPELAATMPWMGQVSPSFLQTTAALDILVGLGVLLPSLTRIKPWLTVLSALAGVALMAGAILFHASRDELAKTPFNLFLAALAAFVAWGRYRAAPVQS